MKLSHETVTVGGQTRSLTWDYICALENKLTDIRQTASRLRTEREDLLETMERIATAEWANNPAQVIARAAIAKATQP